MQSSYQALSPADGCREVELKFLKYARRILEKRLRKLHAEQVFFGEITDQKYRPKAFQSYTDTLPEILRVRRTSTDICIELGYYQRVTDTAPLDT